MHFNDLHYKLPKSALCLFAAIFLLDAITKGVIQSFLPLMHHDALWYPYQGIAVFKNFGGIDFSIVHETNRGAAWGLFGDYQKILLGCRIAFTGALFFYAAFINRQERQTLPLMMIIAGASGNIIDFFFYGHVIDMFKFDFWGYSYPVFNIADSSIFFGVASILYFALFQESDGSQKTIKAIKSIKTKKKRKA